jgi:general secretion pathway protein J
MRSARKCLRAPLEREVAPLGRGYDANRCSLGQQSGFTLLELLVALVVLGFLMVGLTQGVRIGLAMWGAQTRRLGETAELDVGARALRMLLSDIQTPRPSNVGAGAATPNFEASSDKLTFVGDLPTGFGTTRRANITLELVQERLVLLWTPHRHERTTAPEPEPKPTETELIRGVERLEFAYWGAASPDQPAGWQDQSGGPPELIRVRLTFPKGDRRRWPDLIVAPLASGPPQATGQRQR